MELVVTQKHVDWAKLHGACEEIPEVGQRVDSLSYSQLSWMDELGFDTSELTKQVSPETVGVLPPWAFSGYGYGDGYGDGSGYGYGYGSGDGSGYGYGYGDGDGDGYGYGDGSGYGDGYGSGYGYGSGSGGPAQ